jgi:hypothetical protein
MCAPAIIRASPADVDEVPRVACEIALDSADTGCEERTRGQVGTLVCRHLEAKNRESEGFGPRERYHVGRGGGVDLQDLIG